MIKAFHAYRFADSLLPRRIREFIEMSEIDEQHYARDPSASEWFTYGFVNSHDFNQGYANFGASVISNFITFRVEKRERILPGKVIQDHVAKKAAEIERQQGYRPGKKQMAEIKDHVVAELLPTAFIKRTQTLVIMTRDFLIIGTGSSKAADDIFSLLRVTFGHDNLACTFINGHNNLPTWLTVRTIFHDENASDVAEPDCVFTPFPDGGCVLDGGNKQVVRFKDIDAHSEKVQALLHDGYRTSEIPLLYREDCSFRLNRGGVFKGFKFSDIRMAQHYEDMGESDVNATEANLELTCGTIQSMLLDLEDSLQLLTQKQPSVEDDTDDDGEEEL